MREAIHRFNEIGLDWLDADWEGASLRLLHDGEQDLIAATAHAHHTEAFEGQRLRRSRIRGEKRDYWGRHDKPRRPDKRRQQFMSLHWAISL